MKTWQKLKQNPESFNRYFVKEYTIKAIRKFFEERNYHELESPILSEALPQERYLDVLKTNIQFQNGQNKDVYLIPSTETWNKKILVAGLGNHFVITKVFRGLEEISPNHSPEFTMLEWYQVGETYFDLMNTCEDLVKSILDYLIKKQHPYFTNGYKINYAGLTIDFSQKWDRFSVRELLKKYVDINLEDIIELEDFRKIALTKGFSINKDDDWQTIFEIIFATSIEPNFSKNVPTFVYDYPKILCPLTKVKDTDSLVSEKVELYIAGKEVGNGYTELLDWQEQEKRFIEEQKARAAMNKDPIEFDYDFIEALKVGMPPVAGIGIGIDRLVMILANAENISDINYFPAAEW